jgi:hypothetical protein
MIATSSNCVFAKSDVETEEAGVDVACVGEAGGGEVEVEEEI